MQALHVAVSVVPLTAIMASQQRREGFSFARRWCLVAPGGRTGDAAIPRGEDQPGRHGGHPRLGAGSGRKALAGATPAR